MLHYARALLASSVADTQNVTTGTSGTAGTQTRKAGFFSAHGSIVDGTSNLYSGAAINELYWDENGGAPFVHFTVAGTQANSGWTRMVIDGTVSLNRAAAVFAPGGGQTIWEWDASVLGVLFGANGSNHTVVFF